MACGIAWLMWKHSLSSEEALERVTKVHQWCDPNLGFVSQLKQLEQVFINLLRFRDSEEIPESLPEEPEEDLF